VRQRERLEPAYGALRQRADARQLEVGQRFAHVRLRHAQLDPPLFEPLGERFQLPRVRVRVGMLQTGGPARADHAGGSRGRGRGRRVMMMVVMVVMVRMAVRPGGGRVRMVVMVAAHHARAVHARGVQRTVAGPVRHRRQRGHRRRRDRLQEVQTVHAGMHLKTDRNARQPGEYAIVIL